MTLCVMFEGGGSCSCGVQGLLTSVSAGWKNCGLGLNTGAGHSGFGSIWKHPRTWEFSEAMEDVCLEQTEHSSKCLLDAWQGSRCLSMVVELLAATEPSL